MAQALLIMVNFNVFQIPDFHGQFQRFTPYTPLDPHLDMINFHKLFTKIFLEFEKNWQPPIDTREQMFFQQIPFESKIHV
jgi:hypothetical protein